MTKNKDINWINNAKALCMIAVYYIHSLVYYGNSPGGEFMSAFLYPFYVNLFFFVSGYLFFKKALKITPDQSSDWTRKSLASVLFKLVIPTILFSTAIYIPKLLFHSRDISVARYFYDVWGGVSFWFTSALTLMQLIFILIVRTGVRKLVILILIGVLMFISGNFLETCTSSPFPWHYKSALCASLFFVLGGTCCDLLQSNVKSNGIKYAVILAYIALILLTFSHRHSLMYGSMGVGYNFWGTMICLLSIVSMVFVSEFLGQRRLLEFIGRKSIAFYFFSGVMPALFGTIALKVFPQVNNAVALLVTSLALSISAFTTWVIDRYMPFLFDLRIIFKKK